MTQKATVTKLPIKAPVQDQGFFQALDAMENLIANLGTSNDSRMFTRYKEKFILNRVEIEAMYVENWLAGKGIDIIPDDMTREWRTINTSVKPDMVKEFSEFEEDLNVVGKFNEASKWARLYGGCGIILGIDSRQGGQPEEPLDIEFLGKDSLTHLTVIEAERLTYSGGPIITDPTNPRFGFPELYRIANTSQTIHHSRILFFDGLPLPYYLRERQRLAFWGAPVLRRVMETIINSDMGTNGIATLMTEASVDIIKYKGLTSFLAQPGGEEKIRSRFALMKLLKGINNTMLLDEEETFENHQQAFSGLSDLMEKFLAMVAGAFDIPVTRLVGTSAKGMSATGEGDLTNYYDNIRARQRREYNPQLRKLDAIMQRSLWGKEADEWGFSWNSLFQLTEKEIAEMENTRATRDKTYLETGVVDEHIVASQLYEDGTYSNIDQTFLDELEKQLEELAKEEEENKLLMAQQLKQPNDGDDEDEDEDGDDDEGDILEF